MGLNKRARERIEFVWTRDSAWHFGILNLIPSGNVSRGKEGGGGNRVFARDFETLALQTPWLAFPHTTKGFRFCERNIIEQWRNK